MTRIPTVDEAMAAGADDDLGDPGPRDPAAPFGSGRRPLDGVGQLDIGPEMAEAYRLAGRPLPTAAEVLEQRRESERRRIAKAEQQERERAERDAQAQAAWHRAHGIVAAQPQPLRPGA
jgi:hypothetical protein